MTAGTLQHEVCEFVTRLLESSGGVVEWSAPDEEGTALLPREVAALLHAPVDEVALSARPKPGAVCVSLASDFLELSAGVLDAAVPRVGVFRAPERNLKRGDLQESVDRAYGWLNARVRVRDGMPRVAEYHTWWFHGLLKSEDSWETRAAVTLNARTLVEVDVPDPLELFGLEQADAPPADLSGTLARAAASARRRVLESAAPFLARMDDRRRRDQKRLRDYYNSLLREAKTPSKRLKVPPTPEEMESKQRAVQLELRRKLAELDERYVVEATLRPIVVLRTLAPVLAVELNVQRKQAVKLHTVYWNSLTRQFEPLACSQCGAPSFSLAFTNDDVQPLCAACHGQREPQPAQRPK
jgi:hypothetical protein